MTARARRAPGAPGRGQDNGILADILAMIHPRRQSGAGITVADEAWLLAQGSGTERENSALILVTESRQAPAGAFTRELIRDPEAFTREEAIDALTAMGLEPTEQRIASLTTPRQTRAQRAGHALGAAAATIGRYARRIRRR